jgi:hypothetical protein
MDRRRLLLAGFGPLLAACHRMTAARAGECQMCRRPAHAESRSVASVNGREGSFCCLACALAAVEQGAKSLKIALIVDYESKARLDPERAFLVRSSDVNPCAHRHSIFDASKRASQVAYDRCSPSVLAFRSRTSAERFMASHGGALVTLADLR